MAKQAGRPSVYEQNTVIVLCSGPKKAKLQRNSERRAIVDFVVDNQGRATIEEIETRFGYDIKAKIQALVYSGWLEIEK